MNNLISKWFEDMCVIWIDKNPEGIRDLLSDNLHYYEDPHEEPLTTKDKVVDAWQEIKLQNIVNIEIKPLIILDNEGSAMYRFEYINENDKKQVSLGSYYLKVDEDGKATEFRQWWV